MKYRVKNPFMAVHRRNDGTSEFVQLQPGMVLTVRSGERNGMVNVMYDRRILAVFMSDIEERAVQVSEASS
jgi:hypothetical protein